MRMWISALLIATVTATAAACSSNSGGDRKDAAAPPPAPTVFDDQLKAIDKAKAVDTEMRNRVHDLDRQIDNPGDSAAPAGDDPQANDGSH